MVLWWLTRPSGTNIKITSPFHHRGLEYKSRKSRNTWSYRQVWPWSTKWSSAKANKFCQENVHHRKHSLSTTQEMILHVDIAGWSTQKSDGLYLCSWNGEALYSQQKQDWEQTVAQTMNSLLQNSDLKWRKWGKSLDYSGMT